MSQETLPSAAFFRMFHEEDAERGLRPPCLGVPPGQLDRIPRGTAQQIVDHTFVPVQILDGPVPQMGEKLVVLGAAPTELMSDARPLAVLRSADWWPEALGVVPVPQLAQVKEHCPEDGRGPAGSGHGLDVPVIAQRHAPAVQGVEPCGVATGCSS